jgi:hypothetical protein
MIVAVFADAAAVELFGCALLLEVALGCAADVDESDAPDDLPSAAECACDDDCAEDRAEGRLPAWPDAPPDVPPESLPADEPLPLAASVGWAAFACDELSLRLGRPG